MKFIWSTLFKLDISSNRIYGLDILRSAAILFVLIGHSRHFLSAIIPDKILRLFLFDGVSIFFVLSGFLIGRILIKELIIDKPTLSIVTSFWLKRWFRTLPNYFLILFTLLLISSYEDSIDWNIQKSYFYFFQNFSWKHPDSFFPEAWSLAVEEWFYIFIPLLLMIMSFTNIVSTKKSLLYIVILILIFSTYIRYSRFESGIITNLYEWDVLIKKQVITRLDSLMFGVIGSFIIVYHNPIWVRHKKNLFIAGLSLFSLHKVVDYTHSETDLYTSVFSFSIFSLAILFLIPYLENLKSGKGIIYKSLTYISLSSYSMYLINLSLIQLFIIPIMMKHLSIKNQLIEIMIQYSSFWVFTFAISILLYRHFELPIMKLRNRIIS